MAKGKNQAKQAAAKAAEREAIRAENQEARYKDELKRSENLIRQREKEIETTQRLGSAELKQEEAILRHMKAQEALYELMASQKELIGEDLEAKKALTIAIEGQTKRHWLKRPKRPVKPRRTITKKSPKAIASPRIMEMPYSV